MGNPTLRFSLTQNDELTCRNPCAPESWRITSVQDMLWQGSQPFLVMYPLGNILFIRYSLAVIIAQ